MARPTEPDRQTRKPAYHNAVALAKRMRCGPALSKRVRGGSRNERCPYAPPEDWHEPSESRVGGYRVIVQTPGPGYCHVVTADEVRGRLDQLPAHVLAPLEVVQLSRMTRKKRGFPCYGMQWGATVYLYPIEDTLEEFYGWPPKPAQRQEARMFGGRWIDRPPHGWSLVWTEAALKDFYLNNILIHELGHLLDNRNTSYTDRERYAEWFAIEHGYKKSARGAPHRGGSGRRIIRRHHAV